MRALRNAEHRGDWEGTLVAISGEIDMSCRALPDALEGVMRINGPYLMLDLTGVTFIDCAGLGVLIRARRRAEALGGSLRIVAASDRVKRLIALTSLQDLFLSPVSVTAGRSP